MFFIGFLAASIANANTFSIIKNLHDEDVREVVISQALLPLDECQSENGEEEPACIKSEVTKILDVNELPIGWSNLNDKSETLQEFGNKIVVNTKDIGTNLLGYFVTALAIMMGAAFWFDLLKKFVNVRNAGPKPPLSSSGSQGIANNTNTNSSN